MGWPVSSTWMDALGAPHTLRWLISSVRGGTVLADNMAVQDVSCTATWDGQQVVREFKATVVDASQELLYTDPLSPLAPWGQRLQVRAQLSVGAAYAELVPIGEFRIEESDGDIGAAILQSNGSWLFAGQQVTVTSRDMLQQLADEAWTTPLQRISGNTVTQELGRVLSGTGVRLSPSVNSTHQPGWGLEYGSTRLDSVLALAKAIDSVVWTDRTGALALISPDTGTGVTWQYTPGSDVWVTWNPSATRQDVKNGVLVQSTDNDSTYAIRGAAWETSGPLRWGGPFGRVPEIVVDDRAYSSAGATTRAQTELAKLGKSRVAQVIVKAPSNPAVDVLDTAVIHASDRDMTGLIQAVDWGEETMKITVQVPWSQVWIEP